MPTPPRVTALPVRDLRQFRDELDEWIGRGEITPLCAGWLGRRLPRMAELVSFADARVALARNALGATRDVEHTTDLCHAAHVNPHLVAVAPLEGPDAA